MKQIILAIPVLLAPLVCHAGMVEEAGIAGGIVVHLNCGDGERQRIWLPTIHA